MAWSQRTTQLLEDVCTAAVQALTSASGGLGLTRGASAPGHAASSGGQWVPLAGGVTALSSPAHSVRQSLFGSSADSGGAVGPGERDTELVEEDFSLRQRVMGRMFRATSRKVSGAGVGGKEGSRKEGHKASMFPMWCVPHVGLGFGLNLACRPGRLVALNSIRVASPRAVSFPDLKSYIRPLQADVELLRRVEGLSISGPAVRAG